MFHGSLRLFALGRHYYTHRAEVAEITIYTTQAEISPWKSLLVTSDHEAFQNITNNIDADNCSQLQFRVLLSEKLLEQVVEDGFSFLRSLAAEIHKAVSANR